MFAPSILIVTFCPSPSSPVDKNPWSPTFPVNHCSRCGGWIVTNFDPDKLVKVKPACVVHAVCDFCSVLDYWRYVDGGPARTIRYTEAKRISAKEKVT